MYTYLLSKYCYSVCSVAASNKIVKEENSELIEDEDTRE
jgi:hypothetical protein